MQDMLSMIYYWLKAGHILFVIFWMAGLFMLPRLYVYHQECAPDSAENARWVERERRLITIILNPSIVVGCVLGSLLAINSGAFSETWLHVKLLFVLLLCGFRGWLVSYGKKLARGERSMSDRNLRLLNEVPGVAAAIIVILAVVKPF